jgi:two-component system CheB/CheR fusion protein
VIAAISGQELESLLVFLKERRGLDFTGYKRASLTRRVTRRLQQLGIDQAADYLDCLEVDPEEYVQLLNTILINVTAFFRDAPAWRCIAEEIIPRIIASKEPSAPIRVWSAGCASGEEPYGIAILLAEALGITEYGRRVKIYGTDVDDDALSHARQASYAASAVQPIPQELREKYLTAAGSRYVINLDLRRSVIFGRHDLTVDAPISNLDLLVCRNTLMYFNADSQRGILRNFHFALNDEGFLFLGRAEMLLTHGNLFTPVDLKHRVFAKVPEPLPRNHALAAAEEDEGEAGAPAGSAGLLREAALEAAPVPQLLVERSGRLAAANESARNLFELSPDDVGRPFWDLALSYRPLELRPRIEQAYHERRTVAALNVEYRRPDGDVRRLEVQITPSFAADATPLGASINFNDVTVATRLQEQVRRSREELETAYEELQSSSEELETTNEELQSSNEELETTNEELQSANEELETMNEELQSTNEELRTTNEQLREISEGFTRANAYLESIVGSIHAAVVVVGPNLEVQLWNRRAEDLWGLRAEEVQGRQLSDLDIGLPVNELTAPIAQVMGDRSAHEDIVVAATTRRGRSVHVRVACDAVHGPNKEIQGVILLMDVIEDQSAVETADG